MIALAGATRQSLRHGHRSGPGRRRAARLRARHRRQGLRRAVPPASQKPHRSLIMRVCSRATWRLCRLAPRSRQSGINRRPNSVTALRSRAQFVKTPSCSRLSPSPPCSSWPSASFSRPTPPSPFRSEPRSGCCPTRPAVVLHEPLDLPLVRRSARSAGVAVIGNRCPTPPCSRQPGAAPSPAQLPSPQGEDAAPGVGQRILPTPNRCCAAPPPRGEGRLPLAA